MFEFAYPAMLFFLLLIPLLWLYLAMFKRYPAIKVSTAAPFREGKKRRLRRLSAAQYIMLGACTVMIFAMARPRRGDERVIVRARGIDIIIAIDMSGSMQAMDVPSKIRTSSALFEAVKKREVKHRLDVAKEEIARFIKARPNDRIGLLGFADLAYSFSAPTLDHKWLIERLEQLEPGMIGDATGIASPIASAVSRLKESKAPRRVLVLFTDGANTAENRITPEQAALLAHDYNVIIHTVGIGSQNAYVLDESFGSRFIPVGDSFDEKLLRTLAEKTGGSYFHAADAEGMKKVMAEINKLEKTTIEQPRYVEYKEYAPALAAVAALLIALSLLLSNAIKLQIP